MTPFKKKLLVLRSLLIGKGFYDALAMMEFAQQFHTGFRKDGKTPEFQHQIEIALYVMTLPDLMFPQSVLATVFGHDLGEDYDVSLRDIHAIFTNTKLADMTTVAIELLTKQRNGVKKDETALFSEMAKNPIASIVKPSDRGHNQDSMVGVFTIDKQKLYIVETNTLILPMLKAAKRNFPTQTMAYENMKHLLVSQNKMITAIHEAHD